MILFALSIFGLTQVTYAILENKEYLTFLEHALAVGIPLLLGIIFWKILSFRKK
jgi:hypothetical protein